MREDVVDEYRCCRQTDDSSTLNSNDFANQLRNMEVGNALGRAMAELFEAKND